ncbi:MAG TPA: AMP-binding protein [Amaricoccus sp.]|uniref:AMP-binding protein n=1 Tax=Amaricoccus sp. TaxID=1872485 RepID=UPI002C069AFD|nr:AMP-binding protein [Amaricoccus sp.]HRO09918.1 AMP-binding protein [Amaricoccus sp.]
MNALVQDRQNPGGDVVSRRVEGDLHRATLAELAARARRVAGAFATAGLSRDDAVATLAWNGHRHLELAAAADAAGLRFVPLDPRGHPDEIVRAADAAGARALFFDLTFMPLVEEIGPRLASVRTFIAMTDRADMPGPGAIPNLLCYEDLVACRREAADPITETPSFISAAAPEADLRREDIVLAAVPLFHRDGRDLVHAALAVGARLVLPGPWLDGRSLHRLVDREGVTVIAARPLIWQGLLAHLEREGAGLPSVRRAIVDGESSLPNVRPRALGDGPAPPPPPPPPAPPRGGGGARGTAPRVASRRSHGRHRGTAK